MIKVLLADDDFLVRTFLSRITDWEKHGYKLVGAAQDGEEALRMAKEYEPDIIITDISMPVMDGIELIRRLKEEGNAAVTIVLSCHDDFDYVKEAMKLGANEYVLKNLLTENKLLTLLEEVKSPLFPPIKAVCSLTHRRRNGIIIWDCCRVGNAVLRMPFSPPPYWQYISSIMTPMWQ